MIDIVGKRKYFFALSVILILAGIAGLLVNGLNLDIQFQGGTIMQLQMNDDTFDAEKAGALASSIVGKTVSGQKLQTYNAKDANKKIDLLMLKISSENTLTDEEINKVVEAMRAEYKINPEAEMQVQSVQPFIGRELLSRGIRAAVLASVLIVLYVWWRFSVMSGLSAATMAIVALLHDAMIMFSVYTILRLPLNESFIAAILTILGYSMNDTIIIYDRIRENSTLLRKSNLPELVNKSIMQTLSRSINTTVTTLICVVTVYVFAVINNISSLRDFSLPLIVGLASGAYSSIFIACPLWMMWKQHKAEKRVAAKA